MRTLVLFVLVASAALACSRSRAASSPPACRDGVIDDGEVGVRTGAEGAKTGVKTAVEGVKTFGSATAGLVEGGTGEAKARWKDGSEQTKETAHAGGAETKKRGRVPRCR